MLNQVEQNKCKQFQARTVRNSPNFVSGRHSLALSSAGRVFSWGRVQVLGRSVHNATTGSDPIPMLVALPQSFIAACISCRRGYSVVGGFRRILRQTMPTNNIVVEGLPPESSLDQLKRFEQDGMVLTVAPSTHGKGIALANRTPSPNEVGGDDISSVLHSGGEVAVRLVRSETHGSRRADEIVGIVLRLCGSRPQGRPAYRVDASARRSGARIWSDGRQWFIAVDPPLSRAAVTEDGGPLPGRNRGNRYAQPRVSMAERSRSGSRNKSSVAKSNATFRSGDGISLISGVSSGGQLRRSVAMPPSQRVRSMYGLDDDVSSDVPRRSFSLGFPKKGVTAAANVQSPPTLRSERSVGKQSKNLSGTRIEDGGFSAPWKCTDDFWDPWGVSIERVIIPWAETLRVRGIPHLPVAGTIFRLHDVQNGRPAYRGPNCCVLFYDEGTWIIQAPNTAADDASVEIAPQFYIASDTSLSPLAVQAIWQSINESHTPQMYRVEIEEHGISPLPVPWPWDAENPTGFVTDATAEHDSGEGEVYHWGDMPCVDNVRWKKIFINKYFRVHFFGGKSLIII